MALTGCSFCGTPLEDFPDLVLLPGKSASICLGCVDTVRDVLDSRLPDEGKGHPPPERGCDFCGGKGAEVRGLIVGAMGSVCTDCAKKLVSAAAARAGKG